MHNLQQTVEEWKLIEEFPVYEVSNKGSIRHVRLKKILKPWLDASGYPKVSMTNEGKRIVRMPHRIVAQAFIPNPYVKSQVNHKDKNRANYAISNLEWCTRKENMTHAFMHIPKKSTKASKKKRRAGYYIEVYLNNEIFACCKSANDAARICGITKSTISNYLSLGIPTKKGYSFKTGEKIVTDTGQVINGKCAVCVYKFYRF